MAPRKDGTARDAGAISLSQASTNFGHSTARLRRIKKLQFGIINPDELRQYSVTQTITVNGRKIPAGVTRYEVRTCDLSFVLCVLDVFVLDGACCGENRVEIIEWRYSSGDCVLVGISLLVICWMGGEVVVLFI